jgi:hypothetical protein
MEWSIGEGGILGGLCGGKEEILESKPPIMLWGSNLDVSGQVHSTRGPMTSGTKPSHPFHHQNKISNKKSPTLFPNI